jgi:hypothetical protein
MLLTFFPVQKCVGISGGSPSVSNDQLLLVILRVNTGNIRRVSIPNWFLMFCIRNLAGYRVNRSVSISRKVHSFSGNSIIR